MNGELSEASLRALCFLSFDVLVAKLNSTKRNDALSAYLSPALLDEQFPLFVTWNKLWRSSYRLCGCIGTFEPTKLSQGIPNYALVSALEDTRFRPIQPLDIPSLQCCVSLLTEFEPASSPTDWEIGVHGIRIRFKDSYNGRQRGATYLPEVALEQNWNHAETLESLMRKAGWTRHSRDDPSSDPWLTVNEFEVVRYQSAKSHATYDEYMHAIEDITRPN